MKTNHLHTKRESPRGSLFRRLQASTSRRHRVAAAAAAASAEGIELEGDVPNVGVARALLIILALHLVAIAGIFVHNRYFDGEKAANAAPDVPSPVVTPRAEALPKIADTDKPHVIVAGDSYQTVAAQYSVTEDDLRRANDNMVLRAGRILRIPPRRIVAVEPTEMADRRDAAKMDGRGDISKHGAEGLESEAQAGVDGAPRAAVLIKAQAPVTGRSVGKGAAVVATGGTYAVKPGDSLWRIATRHGITPERLMQANGIKDPKRLRAGMELKIPKL